MLADPYVTLPPWGARQGRSGQKESGAKADSGRPQDIALEPKQRGQRLPRGRAQKLTLQHTYPPHPPSTLYSRRLARLNARVPCSTSPRQHDREEHAPVSIALERNIARQRLGELKTCIDMPAETSPHTGTNRLAVLIPQFAGQKRAFLLDDAGVIKAVRLDGVSIAADRQLITNSAEPEKQFSPEIS